MKKVECRIMPLEDSLRELANFGSPVDLAVAATECLSLIHISEPTRP